MPIVHAVGWLLGWFVYLIDSKYRQRIKQNLKTANLTSSTLHYSRILFKNVGESGKALLELLCAWSRTPTEVAYLCKKTTGWSHVEAAREQGKSILFITPHLGAYEVGGHFLASKLPLLAMFRPPKLKWLAPLMQEGRDRDDSNAVSADGSGVRKLLKALKSGSSTMILPDQVPGNGDGEWAPFFGRPAYTMTLAARLAVSTGAVVIPFFAERLSFGRGYHVHFLPPENGFTGDKTIDATLLNQIVEKLIRQQPEQYLWSYNRFKTPKNSSTPVTRDNLPAN